MDLTASNPTHCGFQYDPELLRVLAAEGALDYSPEAKGGKSARLAIVEYYGNLGILIDPERILLTTSTSEAYGYLFKLLCNPEEEVLVPRPSYPLFEFLADAEVVKVVDCPLVYDFGWQLDMEGLRRAITDKTRALVLVHPNNPTGHFTTFAESQEIATICKEREIALIVDEVFLDYGLGKETAAGDRGSFLGRVAELGVLTFVVSGLSKVAGLPQMKVAWLAAAGQGSEEAMERLEVLADTYLSVNTPMQLALPEWLRGRRSIQDQIRMRTEGNLRQLDRMLEGQTGDGIGKQGLVNRLAVEGGWYAVLRIPAVQPDELTVLALLERGVWVQPGYFYGFGLAGWLVISLLTQPSEFSTGLSTLLKYLS